MRPIPRRSFLAAAAAAVLPGRPAHCRATPRSRGSDPALAGEVGLVAATFAAHQPHRAGAAATIELLDIPRILRDELDMRVLDLNTVNFPDFEPTLLDKFRARASEAGCVLTNLKLNRALLSDRVGVRIPRALVHRARQRRSRAALSRDRDPSRPAASMDRSVPCGVKLRISPARSLSDSHRE